MSYNCGITASERGQARSVAECRSQGVFAALRLCFQAWPVALQLLDSLNAGRLRGAL